MQARSRTAHALSCLAVFFFLLPIVSRAQPRVSFGADDADRNYELLELALTQRGSIHVVEMPLKDVAEELSRQFDVPIRLVLKKLEEASVSPDSPITQRLENLTLESHLRHILTELELTFTIRDGIIVITTPEDAESRLITRVYPVLDLFALRIPQHGSAFQGEYYPDLIDVITATIAPDSWDAVGGPGAVEYLDNAGALIISQTRDVHREVEGLLTSLRRTKSYQGIITRGLSPSVPESSPVTYSPRRLPSVSSASVRSWQLPQVHRGER